MSTFRVVLNRSVLEDLTVEICADTSEQAEKLALLAGDRQYSGEGWEPISEGLATVISVSELPKRIFRAPAELFVKTSFISTWEFAPVDLRDFMRKNLLTLRVSILEKVTDGKVEVKLYVKDFHGREVFLSDMPEAVELMRKNGAELV